MKILLVPVSILIVHHDAKKCLLTHQFHFGLAKAAKKRMPWHHRNLRVVTCRSLGVQRKERIRRSHNA